MWSTNIPEWTAPAACAAQNMHAGHWTSVAILAVLLLDLAGFSHC